MSKVNLIIPTHNRTEYLKRILNYYQMGQTDFDFIIADSSTPRIRAENKKIISSYSTLSILYIDDFDKRLAQSQKFAEMVKYAGNKYVVFCADDDFIIPSAIKKCVDFLERNPDYSAAHGDYIGFQLYRNLLGLKTFGWNLRYSPISIISKKPSDRLDSYLRENTQVLWSVRRTNIVKACYKEFSKVKLDPYLIAILGEFIPDALTVIFGKVKQLNIFYGARQYFGSVLSFYPNFRDAQKNGKYDDEFTKIEKCFIENLRNVENISEDNASNIINSAMKQSINSSYQQYLVNRIYFTLKDYPFLSNLVKLLHTNYLFSKKRKGFIDRINMSSPENFKDFDSIRHLVLQSNL